MGANICSNLAYAPFLCEKVWHWMDWWMGGWVDGWMDGWMEGRAGLRIAYSNQRSVNNFLKFALTPEHLHENILLLQEK